MENKILNLYMIITFAIFTFLALAPNVSAQAEPAMFGGIICTIYIVMIILVIFLGIWVYRDAESRGQNGALWLLVVLVGGLIGLIIYFVVRSGWPQHPPMYQYGPPPQIFPCKTCGMPLTFIPQENRWYCNRCQKYV